MKVEIDPNSFRFQVLTTGQEFKASWVELGEIMTKVASEKMYLKWGFKSFEEYCHKEIGLKKNTAIKLTNAWFFLNSKE